MLTETQLHTLRAAMDTLIPPDEYPGAWDNGTGDYLLRQLNGDLAHLAQEYQLGLDSLDREAHTVYGQAFAALTPTQRADLFTAIENGDAQGIWPISSTAFLSLMVAHTAEGYYGDPGQGGNLNHASWDMIGYVVTG